MYKYIIVFNYVFVCLGVFLFINILESWTFATAPSLCSRRIINLSPVMVIPEEQPAQPALPIQPEGMRVVCGHCGNTFLVRKPTDTDKHSQSGADMLKLFCCCWHVHRSHFAHWLILLIISWTICLKNKSAWRKISSIKKVINFYCSTFWIIIPFSLLW